MNIEKFEIHLSNAAKVKSDRESRERTVHNGKAQIITKFVKEPLEFLTYIQRSDYRFGEHKARLLHIVDKWNEVGQTFDLNKVVNEILNIRLSCVIGLSIKRYHLHIIGRVINEDYVPRIILTGETLDMIRLNKGEMTGITEFKDVDEFIRYMSHEIIENKI